MAIPYAVASMIVQEHKNQPITGRILLIGRQTIDMNVQTAVALVESILGHVRTKNPALDHSTRARNEPTVTTDTISDAGFFSLFTDAIVTAVDVTDYEGADIVHDMCSELPSHMIENYDFVYNGSCLDNIFDVAAAMRNFGLCLKPTGRLFQIEAGTTSLAAYVVFSPEWFTDFFIANNWEDGNIYVCRSGEEVAGLRFMQNPWDIYHWRPFWVTNDKLIYDIKPRSSLIGMEHIVSIAQRGNGTVHVNPVQATYRPQYMLDAQVNTCLRWLESDRPIVTGHDAGPQYPYVVQDDSGKKIERCYKYCGTIRHPDH
ncbi:MAG: hypothetical protein GKS03_04880 [Alphaproteobacteria bacterium]|nr:hypothetical protein [Alphaproteobacteria bacterium]